MSQQTSNIFAPPTEDEMAMGKPDLFAPPSQEEMALKFDKPKPMGPSLAESAVRGGAKGILFGLADEAAAGLMGAKDWAAGKLGMRGDIDLGDAYETNLNVIRQRDQQAEEQNPWTFHGAELAGTIASPVSRAFAPAEGAGAMGVIGKGAAAGALAGYGNSKAHMLDSPEELGHLGMDVAGGAALGGGLAGAGRLASNFLGKITPENLRRTGTRLLAQSAGAKGAELERAAPLLSAADEAGPAVVGYGSRASDIAEAAAKKARFYGEAEAPAFEGASGPTWRPFGGKAEKVIGGGLVSEEEQAARAAAEGANAAKARDYQSIAQSAAKKAEDQGASSSDFTLPGMGIMASFMSGHASPKHIATMAALGVGKKLVRERGASMSGRVALAGSKGLDAIPEEVGTVAGAANQYLASGQGAQAVTEQVAGHSPESAADIRERRLREVMVKRLRDLSYQGFRSPEPMIVPQSP